MIRRPRQFVVLHLPSGLRTYVNHVEWLGSDGYSTGGRIAAAHKAGFDYPGNPDVRVWRVKIGYERPLAFDSVPLVIRRNGRASV